MYKTCKGCKNEYWTPKSEKVYCSMDCRKTTKGLRFTPFYSRWSTMKKRCQNPNSSSYHHYGSRGIKVCDRWQTFALFAADMYNQYQATCLQTDGRVLLDRIDCDGDYTPDNCRWVSDSVSSQNRRKLKGGTSKYKNVSWDSNAKKWRVVIYAKNKRFHITHCDDEEDAAIYANVAIQLFHGPDALINPV